MKRFAIGGWQHETNSFAPFETDFNAFEMADGWPAKLLANSSDAARAATPCHPQPQ